MEASCASPLLVKPTKDQTLTVHKKRTNKIMQFHWIGDYVRATFNVNIARETNNTLPCPTMILSRFDWDLARILQANLGLPGH